MNRSQEQSLAEHDQAIAEAESRWDGIGQAVAMEIRRLRSARADYLRSIGACCGRQVVTDVESYDGEGSMVAKYRVINCFYTGERCQIANVENLVKLFSILNSEHA